MPRKHTRRPTRRTSDEMYERLHSSFFRADDSAASNFTLIPTARLFFHDITKQISEAKYSVDLQFYTLEADREVMRVLAVCQTAAERGVKVRILVDHLASDPRRLLATRRARKRMNRSANIEIRQSCVRENTTKFTIRDHKKVIVIDGGEHAYIGGINLARRSLRWNDFMIRMDSSAGSLIATDFDSSWNGITEIKNVSTANATLLTDSGEEEAILPFVLKHIKKASNRIWLETPYLDMATIGEALIQAKEQNPEIDIQIIVPRFNNYPIDRLRTKRVCKQLREANIAAYRYGRTYHRLNHAKMIIIDDIALFGSSNFNRSTLVGDNAEITIATRDSKLLQQLERWYREDCNESVI